LHPAADVENPAAPKWFTLHQAQPHYTHQSGGGKQVTTLSQPGGQANIKTNTLDAKRFPTQRA